MAAHLRLGTSLRPPGQVEYQSQVPPLPAHRPRGIVFAVRLLPQSEPRNRSDYLLRRVAAGKGTLPYLWLPKSGRRRARPRRGRLRSRGPSGASASRLVHLDAFYLQTTCHLPGEELTR